MSENEQPNQPQQQQQPPSPAIAAALKQLHIHTRVVRRLAKEARMYQAEAAKLQAELLEQQKAASGVPLTPEEESRLRKRQEVLRESQMMVPDTERRLLAAREKLADLVRQHEDTCYGESLFLEASAELQQPFVPQPPQQQDKGDCVSN